MKITIGLCGSYIYTSRQTSSLHLHLPRKRMQTKQTNRKQTENLPDNNNRKHSQTPEKTPWPKPKQKSQKKNHKKNLCFKIFNTYPVGNSSWIHCFMTLLSDPWDTYSTNIKLLKNIKATKFSILKLQKFGLGLPLTY